MCMLIMTGLAIPLFIPTLSYGQHSGNYTINSTKAVSNTNYLDWSSAISDLLSGTRSDGGTAQGSGVSGPVVFTVYDTIYANTSIQITAVSGASATNRITFKSAGGDSSKCRLVYASGSGNTDDWVLHLNGADFITFSKIGFERTGLNTYGTIIQISNDADNNKFTHCLMKGQKIPSSRSKGFQTGIGSCVYFSGNGDTVELTNNRFLYGYNGVYNLNSGSANYFANNLIDTPGSAGIYVNSQSSFRVISNSFNMGDFGPGGKQYTCYALRLDASSGFTVANNRAIVTAVNSEVCRSFVFSSNTSSAGAPAMVYNNSIYNNGGTINCNGIAINGCAYLNIFYNNILVNNSLADGAALFQYITTTNSKINLVNNNFINKGAGYALSAGDANSSGFDTIDYNNLYSAGPYVVLWNSSTGNLSNLSSFQSTASKCAKCLSLNPGYVSNGDLHVYNIAINGKALPYPKILTDSDNETRSATAPDIGSDEFLPSVTDAGVSAIDSPHLFCAGKQVVKVKFQNFGFDTIKSIQIGWSVNGVTQTGVSWTGSLASGLPSASISLGNYSFSGNTAYDFKVWTYNPNSIADGKTLNDTLKLTKYAALSGNYTIGDTNVANYKTFNQAITAMAERGICGAVTFNVFNGTYKEQLGITRLPGMGSSSPVVFQSLNNDSTKVKISLITAANSGSNNSALQLRGASYVTFKGITFERTGTNLYAQVIHILNGSSHNTFTNCQMLGIPLTAANANAINIWSDQSKDDYNTFRNNYIKYGHISMLYSGDTGTREIGTAIENNVFEGGYNNSIQILHNNGVSIKGNTFLNVGAAIAGNYDIQLLNCDSNINVSNNRFQSNNTANSILLTGCNASTSKPGIISNNSIVRTTGNGISIDGADNQNIVFNSIYFSSSSGTNAAIITSGTSASNIELLNNNIVMQSGEVFHISSISQVSNSNYNNLVSKGSQFVYWAGSYNTLPDLTLASGKDINSYSVNPLFTSATDLHIKNPILKRAGIPVAGVTTDFDGETRNATKPDIGADEFKLVPNDAGITELVSPITGTCAAVHAIKIVIRNYGNDTLKSAKINWTAANIAQTSYNWTGKLPSGASDSFVISNYNFIGSLNPKFVFISTQPNGSADGIEFNDTLTTNRSLRALPNANAGPDKTICLGDTLNIGPNSTTGIGYKWLTLSGIVLGTNSKLNIKPGIQTTYVLEVTNITFGCTKRDTIVVSVNSLPVAVAGTDQNICPGSTAQLGAALQSGFAYSWTSDPAGFTSSSANPSVKPLVNTAYYLKKTNSTSACKSSDTVLVNISPEPTSNIIGLTSACDGEVVTYSTTGATGNTYNWTVNGGTIVSGQNTNFINVRWNTPGANTLEVKESNTATCKDTASFNVTVNANPVAKFGVSSACFGTATNFSDSSTDASTYSWVFGDGGGTSILANPTHTYPSATNYTARLIISSSAGCNDTATRQVNVNPIPVLSFTYVKKPNRTIEFTNTSTVSSGNINTWTWDFGDGNNSAIENPSHAYAVGNFTVKLCVKSAAGCENCTTQNLAIVGLNELALDNKLYVMPNPGSGLFTLNSTFVLGTIIITNSMGQVIETISTGGTEIKIDLSNQAAGIYFVQVNIEGQNKVIKLIKN